MALPMDRVIRSARKYLLLSNQIRMRQQGFLLLRVCLATILRLPTKQDTVSIDVSRLRQLLKEQREVCLIIRQFIYSF